MGFTYRKFSSEDFDQWRALYEGYLSFYKATLTEESKAIVWQRLLSGEIRGLGAFEGDTLVGIAHFHLQMSTWADDGHLYLEDLYVAETARNRGVARALIEAIESEAKSERCSEMYWITRESNSTARSLYDSMALLSDFVRYEIKL